MGSEGRAGEVRESQEGNTTERRVVVEEEGNLMKEMSKHLLQI